ncbi:16S rRNA (guanine(527)-N(7))-methyltransferase RsmG [candidate division WOR-3 bacterium]|nr:16S rRNA (guanine(527)-N(7))-methyltransferase RsmG [candidate division WOR-3 bacterium]
MDRLQRLPRIERLRPGAGRLAGSDLNLDPSFDRLAAACVPLGITLTEDRYRCLCRYAELAREYNSRVNLVSRRDIDRIITYHVVDSLAAARLVPDQSRCCDVGTGAGLPGIPLAVVRSDIRMFLVESVQKKCRFLVHAVQQLALRQTEVRCARAESLEPLACDVVLSRLTGPISRTLAALARHVRSGGSIVLYKSPAADNLPQSLLARHGLTMDRRLDLALPLTSVPRCLIVLRRAIP